MDLSYQIYRLKFKSPSGTSRGVLTTKETYLLRLKIKGLYETDFLGECGLFKGLSFEDHLDYEDKLKSVWKNFDFDNENWWEELRNYPSIQFGIEQVIKAKQIYKEKKLEDELNPILFPSTFTEGNAGIPINGLIWMGSLEFMKKQIKEKLDQGFRCIKMKIGVDWKEELQLLKKLRKEFSSNDLELRVDANGAFEFEKAKTILQELYELNVHSIEQPIKAGQHQEMAALCAETPTPIALDEELIGEVQISQKQKLLETIRPQYIILKPSLVGGWKGSEEWIQLAENQNAGWWITSALESNIGLNAIAQWTYTLNNPLPQGLGTGSLFTNNFHSRLNVVKDQLFFV